MKRARSENFQCKALEKSKINILKSIPDHFQDKILSQNAINKKHSKILKNSVVSDSLKKSINSQSSSKMNTLPATIQTDISKAIDGYSLEMETYKIPIEMNNTWYGLGSN